MANLVACGVDSRPLLARVAARSAGDFALDASVIKYDTVVESLAPSSCSSWSLTHVSSPLGIPSPRTATVCRERDKGDVSSANCNAAFVLEPITNPLHFPLPGLTLSRLYLLAD